MGLKVSIGRLNGKICQSENLTASYKGEKKISSDQVSEVPEEEMLRQEIAKSHRQKRSSRRFTKGIVDPADLKIVFEHFEVLDDGLMDLQGFKHLLSALKLHLKDDEVTYLFQHLAFDVALAHGPSEINLVQMDQEKNVCDIEQEKNQKQHYNTQKLPRINLEQFLAGIRRHRFLRRIISLYTFSDPRSWQVPSSYDYSKSTHENYADNIGYVGELKQIRQRVLDRAWHGNYSPARQLWQDAVAHAVALPRDDTKCQAAHQMNDYTEEKEQSGECAAPERRPWLVFTAGAMGAGKSHSMNWMSARDIFPLRNIVHIDPDRFKQMMPEYPEYLRRDRASAGTMCHRESGLLAELAQEIAMEQRLHVWVDGSLRDFEWHAKNIEQLRARHPYYRIALFYVHASEATVRTRVKKRAERLGGRDVPETVLSASLAAPPHTLRALTPMVDFVARILNEDEPILQAFETVDTSGDWTRIAEMFGGFYRANDSTGGLSRKSSLASFSSATDLDLLSSTPPQHRPSSIISQPSGEQSSSPREASAILLFENLTDRLHRAEREAHLLRSRCEEDAKIIASLRAQLNAQQNNAHDPISHVSVSRAVPPISKQQEQKLNEQHRQFTADDTADDELSEDFSF
uniref:Zeta toxin domain-containing protein n=3 Tax=Aureoumbra lagunensis TaxID=44058 RepID=A0A6S8CUX6_9STRA